MAQKISECLEDDRDLAGVGHSLDRYLLSDEVVSDMLQRTEHSLTASVTGAIAGPWLP